MNPLNSNPQESTKHSTILSGAALDRHFVWATTPGINTQEDLEAELERLRQGADRLKEQLSSHPLYAEKAARNPNFWNALYASQGAT
jgi:hypothetical protein